MFLLSYTGRFSQCMKIGLPYLNLHAVLFYQRRIWRGWGAVGANAPPKI